MCRNPTETLRIAGRNYTRDLTKIMLTECRGGKSKMKVKVKRDACAKQNLAPQVTELGTRMEKCEKQTRLVLEPSI